MKSHILISYDISNDKKRTKLGDFLLNFGLRWQYSLFMCSVTKDEKKKLLNNLEKFTEKGDSIIIVPIDLNLLKQIGFIGEIKQLVEQTGLKVI